MTEQPAQKWSHYPEDGVWDRCRCGKLWPCPDAPDTVTQITADSVTIGVADGITTVRCPICQTSRGLTFMARPSDAESLASCPNGHVWDEPLVDGGRVAWMWTLRR